MRRILVRRLAALVVALHAVPAMAHGEQRDPPFINLTTDDAHRANMAPSSFGGNQMQCGHPRRVFHDDRAVLIGGKATATRFAGYRKMHGDLTNEGAVVIGLPCEKHDGVHEPDPLTALEIGHPQLTGAALLRKGARMMTW